MIRPPPSSTRTDTPIPSTTLFRSRRQPDRERVGGVERVEGQVAALDDEDEERHQRQHRDLHEVSGRHPQDVAEDDVVEVRSEEHTSELQSLMRISYAVFCLKKKSHLGLDTNRNPASTQEILI